MGVVEHAICLTQPPVLVAIGASAKGLDEPFCDAGRWRLHLYAAPAAIAADGVLHRLAAGTVALWAPPVALECRLATRALHICAHFDLVPGAPTVRIPQLQEVGARYPQLEQAFLDAVAWSGTQPHRSVARLWGLLWDIVPAAPAAAEGPPAALERARTFIHARLSEELSVPVIAAAAGISATHLLRLFRAHHGASIVAYVRACRVHRAQYLLKASRLPIRTIAAEVGLPDLHRFNKVIRAATGLAPRQLRLQGAT